MSTEMDEWIRAEVERSFADEPPLRDPRAYADRGRRARRLRQAAVGALGAGLATVTAMVVLGGTGPGAGADRGLEPAGEATAPVRVSADLPVDPRQAERCAAGRLGVCDDDISWDDIHFDPSGRLVRGYPDVHVTGVYVHVLDAPYDASAAVELTVRGRTVWALVQRDVGRSTGLSYAPPDPTRTFDQWVQDSAVDGSGGWFTYRPDPDGPGEGATPR